MNDTAPLQRPVMVWILMIYYWVGFFSILILYYLIFIKKMQIPTFNLEGINCYTAMGTSIANFTAVNLLVMLRKEAVYLFILGLLIASVSWINLIFYTPAFHTRPLSDLTVSFTGLGVSVAVILYVVFLRIRGVLR